MPKLKSEKKEKSSKDYWQKAIAFIALMIAMFIVLLSFLTFFAIEMFQISLQGIYSSIALNLLIFYFIGKINMVNNINRKVSKYGLIITLTILILSILVVPIIASFSIQIL